MNTENPAGELVRLCVGGEFISALVYTLTVLLAFPQRTWEFAPGVVCAFDDFGDHTLYFDRRLWTFVDSDWQKLSEQMPISEAYQPILERIGFLDNEAIDSLEEAFEFAQLNVQSVDLSFYEQPRELHSLIPQLEITQGLAGLAAEAFYGLHQESSFQPDSEAETDYLN